MSAGFPRLHRIYKIKKESRLDHLFHYFKRYSKMALKRQLTDTPLNISPSEGISNIHKPTLIPTSCNACHVSELLYRRPRQHPYIREPKKQLPFGWRLIPPKYATAPFHPFPAKKQKDYISADRRVGD